MGSTDSVHYLERDEVNGLKLLQRQWFSRLTPVKTP
jgi:hypothetical protein